VNYEDPNVNVGLPVFSIHGNHDDPAGEANLSAMDILSSAGLVNYFGKHALGGGGAGRVDLKPVLMRKGTTKLALYGLGYIRDNRLHQMFSVKGCVRWHRPAETETCSSSSWFNVMLIHQNRAAHSKNAISDRYLPSWLDFVVWGHEHECLVEPTESAQGFHISQPGSSVVTSLIEGEAKQKKICVLEVRSDPDNPNGAPYWRTTPIDLETTRPFEFDQVALASVEEIDASDPKGIAAYLERRVNTMIDRAAHKHRERHAPKEIDMTDRLNLPLIRLRVDYSGGFSTINPQRFGQKFVGKVANPHDVLLFHKSQKKRTGTSNEIDDEMADDVDAEYEEDPQADGMLENQRRIDRLVREHLSTSEGLQLLTPNDLSAALDDFVNRDEKAAISKLCQTRLKAIQTSVNADERGTDDVSELLSKIHDAVQVQLKKPSKHKPVMDENTAPKNAAGGGRSTGATVSRKPTSPARETALEPVVEQAPEPPRAQTKTPARRAPATRRKSTARSEPVVDVVSDDEIEDSDVEEIPMSNPVTKSRPTRAATIASMRNKKMTAVAEDSDDSFDEADEVIDASDEDIAPAPSTRGRKRPAPAPTKTPKRKAAKPPSGRAARSTRAATAVDDDSGDDVDEIVAPSRTRATRTASGMTQGGTQSTWGRSRR
jgi:double-strand break repair protein MRE11